MSENNEVLIGNVGGQEKKIEVQGRDADGKFTQVSEYSLTARQFVTIKVKENESIQVITLKD